MIDKQTVQQYVSVLGICVVGAILLAVALFIATLAMADYHAPSSADSATPTAQ